MIIKVLVDFVISIFVAKSYCCVPVLMNFKLLLLCIYSLFIFFSDQNGYFFPVIAKNTSKFIKPCSKKIIDWIKSLRDGKQKVFLLTNSYIDFTNLLMNFAVG